MPKRGAISDKERKFLKENQSALSPAEIAKVLDRTEDTVKKWFVTELKISPDKDEVSDQDVIETNVERDFLASPEWEALKYEFTEDELKLFRHRYKKLIGQLKEGMTATEETQVMLVIKYEILMKRNLIETKSSVEDIGRLQDMLDNMYDKNPDVDLMDQSTKNLLTNMENQLLTAKTARQAKSTEYIKLTEKHTGLFRELKATRDQRLTRIDAAAGNLLDTFKSLQREDVQDREGRHMELVALAVQQEKKRLGQLHTYVDGGLDQPLLTPENVIGNETFDRTTEDEDGE